eukprot:m.27890 g.27890  ORF g.27890 m.27890 type:complete len:210 (+) comp30437_c0_seq1:49-678(+)
MSVDSYKVCFLGKINVGKTSLYRRLQNKPYVEGRSRTTPDEGLNQCFIKLTSPSGPLKVDLWDTTGNEGYQRTLTTNHYRNANVVLCVYDITETDSLDSLHHNEAWIADATTYCPRNAVYLLCGNKEDLRGGSSIRPDEEVTGEKLKAFMGLNDLYDGGHVTVSAKTGAGLEELKELIVNCLIKIDSPLRQNVLTLPAVQEKNKRCCDQ